MYEKLEDDFYRGVVQQRLQKLYDWIYGPWVVAIFSFILIMGAARFFDGTDALSRVWPWWVIAAAGAIVAGSASLWWFSRTQPTIMVAEFVNIPADSDDARRD